VKEAAMATRLEGKVAVITGGGSGIGRATALRFLDEGASVVVADLNRKTGQETAAMARERGHGERIRFVRCDVSVEAEVAEAVDVATRELGRLDCIFNNAGAGGAFGPLTEVSVEDWDRTFALLVRGVFLGTKLAARAMIEQGSGGAILNTASIAGLSAGAGMHAYSTCKAAVINFTRSAAVELAPYKIRVNAICPGAILTPLVGRGREAQMATLFERGQPLPVAGRPEHIAAAALFLASDDAAFVTGESLVVDGGLTALGPGLYDGHNPAGNAIIESIALHHGITDVAQLANLPAGYDPGTVEE
jgi:NAD(P)-dependent dehydrogenase (short-subunit alcohol dehydrogenase family)